MEPMDSPTFQEMAKFVGDLKLNGLPLEAPRLGSDEYASAATPAAFVRAKDPTVQQLRTQAEDVPLPRDASVLHVGAKIGTSFARVVHGVLEPSECAELVAQANEKGFVPLDNRFRCMLDCPPLASYLLEVLRPHLPERLCCGQECLEGLNDRFRFTFYLPGQEFEPHCDPCYTHPTGHPKEGQTSRITVLIYLHDVPEDNGGATNFVGKCRTSCQPRGGSALLFTQDLMHEGSIMNAGIKYLVRSELMYKEDEEAKAMEDWIDNI